MKVLVIKMSSLGDVVHCLPAVTDLGHAYPEAEIHWVVEEGFQDIPRLHPGVQQVIPIAIRRWRRGWWRNRKALLAFRAALNAHRYDQVIDAQGLMKSALVSALAAGPTVGFSRRSAREGLAARFYGRRIEVALGQHAVSRQRQLFAGAFGYEPAPEVSYGLGKATDQNRDVYFFHGTTWSSKHWPDAYWLELARLVTAADYRVVLPYLDGKERARAEHIAAVIPETKVLPPGSIAALATGLANAAGAVSVDTGLGHLAVALDLPLVGLYGSTSPALTGFLGDNQLTLADTSLPCAPCLQKTCQFDPDSSNIYPPCYGALSPEQVFTHLTERMAQSSRVSR